MYIYWLGHARNPQEETWSILKQGTPPVVVVINPL